MPKPTNKRKTAIVTLAELEKRAIYAALERTKGHAVKAAKLLGIGKTTLYRKVKSYEKPARKSRKARKR